MPEITTKSGETLTIEVPPVTALDRLADYSRGVTDFWDLPLPAGATPEQENERSRAMYDRVVARRVARISGWEQIVTDHPDVTSNLVKLAMEAFDGLASSSVADADTADESEKN